MKTPYTTYDTLIARTQQHIAETRPDGRTPKKEDLELVIDSFLQVVKNSVVYTAEPVHIPGICVLKFKTAKPTRRQDFKTGTVVDVPAKERLTVTLLDSFLQYVKQNRL